MNGASGIGEEVATASGCASSGRVAAVLLPLSWPFRTGAGTGAPLDDPADEPEEPLDCATRHIHTFL